MKSPANRSTRHPAVRADSVRSGELLLLPDGRILAHNITPALAALLADLDPDDATMRLRATSLPPSLPPATAPHRP